MTKRTKTKKTRKVSRRKVKKSTVRKTKSSRKKVKTRSTRKQVKKRVRNTITKKAVKKVKSSKKTKPKKSSAKKKTETKKVALEINKMDDAKAYDLMKRYRIPLAPFAFCKNEKEVMAAVKKIGFPLVMKVSGQVLHKTEVKGVVLDVNSEQQAIETYQRLMKIKGAEKVLVQKMLTRGFELIVGAKRDPHFDGVVALGAGGVFTELLKDVSFRVTPLTKVDAEQMLTEVKFSELILNGFRGMKPVDKKSIIETLLTVSRIMEKNDDIKEIDINPLFATSKKSFAIDVRIILK